MSLRAVAPAGDVARRAIHVPRELARRGAPLVGRVAGLPDRFLALERYRALADSYDVRTAAGQVYRRQAVETLAPLPGETILDVGCGTGLNFPLLQRGIGSRGRLIGIDLSGEMLDRARARVRDQGWKNVVLLQGPAEEADIPDEVDAALLCGVHDVMRSPTALANVVGHVREGGRVVAGGPKWAPWWQPGSFALNVSTWNMNREFITTFEGFDHPWSHLTGLVADLRVEDVYFGGGYIARGTNWPRYG